MPKYRAIPNNNDNVERPIIEFEALNDFDAAAQCGIGAGAVAVDLEKEVDNIWMLVSHIPGRKLPTVGIPPIEGHPIKRVATF